MASFAMAFLVSGGILLVAAIGWVFAPETRGLPPVRPTPMRAHRPGGRWRSAVTSDFEG